jgi:hypothetical protein
LTTHSLTLQLIIHRWVHYYENLDCDLEEYRDSRNGIAAEDEDEIDESSNWDPDEVIS